MRGRGPRAHGAVGGAPSIGVAEVPFRLLDAFEKCARRSRSAPELFGHSEAVARELGFAWVAIVQGMALYRPDGGYIRMDNFKSFGDVFVERRYYRDDPALLAARCTTRPFTWFEMKRILGRQYGRRQARIVREAAHHGLRGGLTVPVGSSGEPAGCCSFSTVSGVLPPPNICRIAALIASEAFEEARRLHGYPARRIELPDLSPRRLECFRWAAMGKSDLEIAIIMNVAPSTVRTYMKFLLRHFGVYSRAQLPAIAVACGLVDLDEITPGF